MATLSGLILHELKIVARRISEGSKPATPILLFRSTDDGDGAFLLLSSDYRIGAEGAFKIGANEVAIGLTMPRAAIQICRQRLATTHFDRAVITAEIYAPRTAVAAGFLDEVAAAEKLTAIARETAARLAKLNPAAHAATKARVRAATLGALSRAIEEDDAEFAARR
jgi:enoyl-CoA hydratase